MHAPGKAGQIASDNATIATYHLERGNVRPGCAVQFHNAFKAVCAGACADNFAGVVTIPVSRFGADRRFFGEGERIAVLSSGDVWVEALGPVPTDNDVFVVAETGQFCSALHAESNNVAILKRARFLEWHCEFGLAKLRVNTL